MSSIKFSSDYKREPVKEVIGNVSQPQTKNLIDDITGIFGSSLSSTSQPVKNDLFGVIDLSTSSTTQENPQKSSANDLLSNLGAVSYNIIFTIALFQ